MKKFKLSSPVWVFAAMILGAVLGLYFPDTMQQLKFIGDIWLNCLRMIVIPLVLCIMTLAIGGQKDLQTLGRIAIKVIIYYIATTVLASAVGLTVSSLVKPGIGMSLEGLQGSEVKGGGGFTFGAFFSSLFSDNMFASFSKGNVLQSMVIAILLGISILQIKNAERKATVLNWFQSMNDMIYAFVGMVIKASPIGVIFLMGNTFATHGFVIFTSMAGLIATYWLSVLVQILFVYSLFLWVTTGINPYRFLRDTSAVWICTAATCSSAATIPVSLKTAEEKFNVPSSIANFSIPLGAQINYDGSAIMYGCCLMFLCQMNGIHPNLNTLIHMVIVGSLVSSAGGGIPGSGIVKLLVVVETFGLPSELVGIVAGFYRFFDMGITTGNCLGDLTGTIFVSEQEKRRAAKLQASENSSSDVNIH